MPEQIDQMSYPERSSLFLAFTSDAAEKWYAAPCDDLALLSAKKFPEARRCHLHLEV